MNPQVSANACLTRFQWAKIGIHLLACFLLLADASAQSFKAEGNLTYVAIAPNDSFTVHKRFTIARSGCQWIIRTWNSNPADDPAVILKYQETGCDGTNIYAYNLQDRAKVPDIETDKKILFANGNVTQGIVPFPDQSFIFPIWLAFSSECYFRGITNGLVKPVAFPSKEQFGDNSFRVKAEWLFDAISPSFLSSATFFSDGKARGIDAQGNPVVRSYPPPWDKGFPNAVFSASDFRTIADGLRIPFEFQLDILALRPGAGSELQPVKIVSINAEVTSASSTNSFSPLPEIVSEAAIKDRRTAAAGYKLQYFAEKWYATNDPDFIEMNERFVQGNRHLISGTGLTNSQKRFYMWLLMASLGGFGIWLFLKRGK